MKAEGLNITFIYSNMIRRLSWFAMLTIQVGAYAQSFLFFYKENQKMRKDNYNCFSYNQMKWLSSQGVEPIHVMIHQDTKRTFWIFKKCDELDNLLKAWTIRKAQ